MARSTDTLIHPEVSQFKTERLLGRILFFVSVVVASLTLYKGAFVDEADNLVLGSLISQGDCLYRDLFSHHLPFPYYWMAGVIKLFGKSLLIARFSMIIFQWLALGLVMELCGWHLVIGFTGILWAVVRVFYWGHMVTYAGFTSASFLVVFAIALHLIRKEKVNKSHWISAGLFAMLTLLSDPTLILPLMTVFAFILIRNHIFALKMALISILVLLVFGGHLWLTGSITAFYSNVIQFNLETYRAYASHRLVPFSRLLTTACSSLNIADKLKPLCNVLILNTHDFNTIDMWLFTGFFFRLGILGRTVMLLIRKSYFEAIFLYISTSVLLSIYSDNFRLTTFVLLAIFNLALLALGPGKRLRIWNRPYDLQTGVSVIVLTGTLILCTGLIADIGSNYEKFRRFPLHSSMARKELLDKMICDRDDVYLAHYPGGVYSNWVTGLKPVDGYPYMWPWVAEDRLELVIDSLSKDGIRAIVICNDLTIWSKYSTKDYLKPLLTFLSEEYVFIKDDIYVSPSLFSDCLKFYKVEGVEPKDID